MSRAERQVGERLSEQAYIEAHHQGWHDAEEFHNTPIKSPPQPHFVEMARQLAEAERENGRLREALDRIADGRHPTKKTSGELSADGYLPGKKGTMVYVKTLTARDIARAALNPPDPPASPSEGSEHAKGSGTS